MEFNNMNKTQTATLLSFLASSHLTTLAAKNLPPLQPAAVFDADHQFSEFLISEKLDGIRAYWNGKQLVTRAGNPVNAPVWFTQHLPRTPLDGELWVGRGKFESTLSTVSKHQPVDEEWRQVKYMVFDLPASLKPFEKRYADLQQIIDSIDKPHIQPVSQTPIRNKQALDNQLARVIANGGEGLMLHRRQSIYQLQRTDDLQKLKPYFDAEAEVIAQLPGKGRLEGMMGAIRVRTADGTTFKIGSGFSDSERQNPPPVGSIITYRYQGYTNTGKPRFATYLKPYTHF